MATLPFILARIEKRFQPLERLGISAKPTSRKSVSIRTGTPGRLPCTVPALARSPSMVTTPFFRIGPDQTMTPEVGAVPGRVLAAAGTGSAPLVPEGAPQPPGAAAGGLAGICSGTGGEPGSMGGTKTLSLSPLPGGVLVRPDEAGLR